MIFTIVAGVGIGTIIFALFLPIGIKASRYFFERRWSKAYKQKEKQVIQIHIQQLERELGISHDFIIDKLSPSDDEILSESSNSEVYRTHPDMQR